MDPRLDPLDQVELPCAPFDLPDAERRKADRGEHRHRGEQRAAETAQGWALISGVIGIMFPLRWYMIHSEPAITISTSTAVNT